VEKNGSYGDHATTHPVLKKLNSASNVLPLRVCPLPPPPHIPAPQWVGGWEGGARRTDGVRSGVGAPLPPFPQEEINCFVCSDPVCSPRRA
jgi:hypothetical protein